MDKQLEEQVERVRQLSARIERIHRQLAENAELIAREREELGGTPLHRVRDFRMPTAPQADEPPAQRAQRHSSQPRQRATADVSRRSRRERR